MQKKKFFSSLSVYPVVDFQGHNQQLRFLIVFVSTGNGYSTLQDFFSNFSAAF